MNQSCVKKKNTTEHKNSKNAQCIEIPQHNNLNINKQCRNKKSHMQKMHQSETKTIVPRNHLKINESGKKQNKTKNNTQLFPTQRQRK